MRARDCAGRTNAGACRRVAAVHRARGTSRARASPVRAPLARRTRAPSDARGTSRSQGHPRGAAWLREIAQGSDRLVGNLLATASRGGAFWGSRPLNSSFPPRGINQAKPISGKIPTERPHSDSDPAEFPEEAGRQCCRTEHAVQARTRYREVPDEGDCGDGSSRGNGRDDAGGAAGAEAAGNDVVVQVHASGFTPGELTCLDLDRSPRP